MSDTFSWCVSEAWAYLSCVFLCREQFSLLPPSLSNCSVFQSSQPHSSLSFWIDLTMFLRENWQKKKTCPCFRGRYLMPRCWITPPFIGLDHALVMRLADYVFFPGFVLNGVPVVFPFFTPLSSRGMICQRGWKVPNGHSCKQRTSPLNPRVEDKKKMTSILMFVSLFCGFYYFSLNEQNCTSGPIQRLTRRDFWFFR